MRFTASLLTTVTLSFHLAAVAVAAISLPSVSCLQIPTVIDAIDTTKLVSIWQNQVCAKGCNLHLSDYPTKLRPVATAAIQREVLAMGAPELEPYYVKAMDKLVEYGQANCARDSEDEDLCQGTEKIQAMAKCLQGNAWKVALRNALEFAPLLAQPHCQRQIDFFSNPSLWEEVVPVYARVLAGTC